MYGKKVKLRFLFILLLLASIALSVFLILKTLEEDVVYFISPTDIKSLKEINEKKIRVGGMVKKDSIITKKNEINFIITDYKNEILVTYSGSIPNLFAEEKGYLPGDSTAPITSTYGKYFCINMTSLLVTR